MYLEGDGFLSSKACGSAGPAPIADHSESGPHVLEAGMDRVCPEKRPGSYSHLSVVLKLLACKELLRHELRNDVSGTVRRNRTCLMRACRVCRLLIGSVMSSSQGGLNSVGGAHDEQVCSSDKEARLDDSGNQVQGDLEFSRVVDPWEMDIQNHMACFRVER